MFLIDNFIDDMIIFIRIFQDYLLVVEEFLQRFRITNFIVKLSKFYLIQQFRMFGIYCGELKVEIYIRKSGSNREFFWISNKEVFNVVFWFSGFLLEIYF